MILKNQDINYSLDVSERMDWVCESLMSARFILDYAKILYKIHTYSCLSIEEKYSFCFYNDPVNMFLNKHLYCSSENVQELFEKYIKNFKFNTHNLAQLIYAGKSIDNKYLFKTENYSFLIDLYLLEDRGIS